MKAVKDIKCLLHITHGVCSWNAHSRICPSSFYNSLLLPHWCTLFSCSLLSELLFWAAHLEMCNWGNFRDCICLDQRAGLFPDAGEGIISQETFAVSVWLLGDMTLGKSKDISQYSLSASKWDIFYIGWFLFLDCYSPIGTDTWNMPLSNFFYCDFCHWATQETSWLWGCFCEEAVELSRSSSIPPESVTLFRKIWKELCFAVGLGKFKIFETVSQKNKTKQSKNK